MKKILTAMVLCGLAFGMVACGDSDNNKDCLNENPAIVNESAKMHTALYNGASNEDSSINCVKFASNMGSYLEDGSDNLNNMKNAVIELKDYFNNGNVIVNIACALFDGTKMYNAARVVDQDYQQAKQCTTTLATGQDPSEQAALTQLNTAMHNLETIDGWANVSQAAAKAATENANQTAN